MSRSLKSKIAALPPAKRIPKRWKIMQAAKESRHSDTEWKKNPIKLVDTPTAYQVFKKLNKHLRSLMFRKLAVKTEFNPRKLVTIQPVVSASAVLEFAENEHLARKKKAYVLGTELGPCIWNGNHRAVASLLSGRRYTAMYLDLTGESEI